MSRINIKHSDDGHYRFLCTTDLAEVMQPIYDAFILPILNGSKELNGNDICLEFQLTDPFEISVLNNCIKKMKAKVIKFDDINSN